MTEKNWKEIAESLDAKYGQAFESEMKKLATEINEDELTELIEAIGELYPGKDENGEYNRIWGKYENTCYIIFLVFGDVHYADLDDEEYKKMINSLIRPLGFDRLADYEMGNFLSHRRKSK